MDGRHRSRHVTANQKRKLIELVSQNPELISCKVTQNFNYKDSHRLWQSIANQCNAFPGAKKTWRQWRKTFQDLRSKAKRQQIEMNGEIPVAAIMFSPMEQEVLGIKTVATNSHDHSNDATELNTPLLAQEQIILQDNYSATEIDMEENEQQENVSETKSPTENKVYHNLRSSRRNMPNIKKRTYKKRGSSDCLYNCDLLATQEEQKIRIKEDYLNFKKEYLKQKLKLMKEQTEALKSIARELSK